MHACMHYMHFHEVANANCTEWHVMPPPVGNTLWVGLGLGLGDVAQQEQQGGGGRDGRNCCAAHMSCCVLEW